MSFAERIIEGARDVRPARLLANVVGAIPYAVGVLAALAARAVWTLIAWIIAACRLGFRDTWSRRRRPDR